MKRQVRESNPDHIGGRLALSLLCYPLLMDDEGLRDTLITVMLLDNSSRLGMAGRFFF